MYKEMVGPVFDRIGHSEQAHSLVRGALHHTEIFPFTLKLLEFLCAYQHRRFSHQKLRVVLGGIELDNPLLVGAGWDKAGRAVKALYQLGFAGVEVGSVLAYPQEGNPKPRQFVIGPGVALNRLGFNSPGMEVVAGNLERYKGSGIPLGVSIGKNKEIKTKDAPWAHALVAERLYEAVAYFVINVSSPNTPGLRKLQDKGPLTEIVQAVNEVMEKKGKRKPLFIKIDPDLPLGAVDDVIQVVIDNNLTGIVATNTTVNPDIKAKYGESWRNEPGGVSGDNEDFRRMATEKIRHIHKEAGDKLEIVGVGAIKDTATALEKILAGAKALQIVTGLRGEGPTLPGRINRGLVDFMSREGISSIQKIVGQGYPHKTH